MNQETNPNRFTEEKDLKSSVGDVLPTTSIEREGTNLEPTSSTQKTGRAPDPVIGIGSLSDRGN